MSPLYNTVLQQTSYNCKSLRCVTISLLEIDHLQLKLRTQSEMRLSKHGRFSSESISVTLNRRSYPKNIFIHLL